MSIYRKSDSRFFEIKFPQGTAGSINDVIESLGFARAQIHIVFIHDSPKVQFVAFRIFTKQVEFLGLKEGITPTVSLLNEVLKSIDWKFEYSIDNVAIILEDGIAEKSLHLEYLESVLDLRRELDLVYHAPTFGLYLNFENDLLISFTSDGWETTESKWLKGVNKKMYNRMLEEARTFHKTELGAVEEVNLQCSAFRNVPKGLNNEFIDAHVNQFGNINFYNLLLAHHDKTVSVAEFKRVNKGRFSVVDESVLQLGFFMYKFDASGIIEVVESRV